ncbi:MAG TPA: hypothetical protein VN038_24090 [Dyadobacter sp.]|nr:hypothetical protein [Dyadobacter sp.]
MKSIFIFILATILTINAFAQTNGTLHYQGIARNAQGAPLAGATIAIRLSVKDAISNGNTLYSESKSVTTNAFGLYSISINDGSGVKTGDFNAINWSFPRFLQTEIDPANGTAFVNMGTQQMQSTPHALSAKSLDGIVNPQEGDVMEYRSGSWQAKPKNQRFNISGLGYPPTSTLNFLSEPVTVTILKDNPVITIVAEKGLGSIIAGGGTGLSINLGYQKAGGSVTEFDANHRTTGIRVQAGNRVIVSRSGNYQTDFKAGETYTLGMVGIAPPVSVLTWNDNTSSAGYVEIAY